jgi:hypothetical protein
VFATCSYHAEAFLTAAVIVFDVLLLPVTRFALLAMASWGESPRALSGLLFLRKLILSEFYAIMLSTIFFQIHFTSKGLDVELITKYFWVFHVGFLSNILATMLTDYLVFSSRAAHVVYPEGQPVRRLIGLVSGGT